MLIECLDMMGKAQIFNLVLYKKGEVGTRFCLQVYVCEFFFSLIKVYEN